MTITDKIPWRPRRITTVCGIPVSPNEVMVGLVVIITAAAVFTVAIRPGLSVAMRLLGVGR